ncbi:MAG: hypothetical protein MAG453_00723 [Calditrichaeota bacterium]|nr:hypothetical protein [Calditrichota bacterium]
MKRTGVFGLLLAFSLALVLGTGCTKYASEEDLQNLDRQRDAALSAEKALDDCQGEVSRLERMKAEKQAELQEAKTEKAAVQQRLQETKEMKKEKAMKKEQGGM